MNETPIQSGPPEQPWQLTKKPHEWQQVLLAARQALHQNPQDQEALEAIKDANEALSVYDSAESGTWGQLLSAGQDKTGAFSDRAPEFDPDAGSRIREGLIGGPLGIVQSGLETLKGLYELPGAALQEGKAIATDPNETQRLADMLSQIPGAAIEHVKNAGEMTPQEVGHDVGVTGQALLPFARLGAAADASTVGGAVSRGIGRAAKAPFRWAGNIIDKPGITNEMNQANTARSVAAAKQAEQEALLAGSKLRGQEMVNTQLKPAQIAGAEARAGIAEETLGRQGTLSDQALERLKLLQNETGRAGPTTDNLNLRNRGQDLTNQLREIQLRNAQATQGGVESSGLFESGGPSTPPQPLESIPGTSGDLTPVEGGRGRMSPKGPLPPEKTNFPPSLTEMQGFNTNPRATPKMFDPTVPFEEDFGPGGYRRGQPVSAKGIPSGGSNVSADQLLQKIIESLRSGYTQGLK